MRYTSRITTADRITYVYRMLPNDSPVVIRRPVQGYTNHEWVTYLRSVRNRLFATGERPAYENLTTGGKAILLPGRHTSRAAEIADALNRLCEGCPPSQEPYVIG